MLFKETQREGQRWREDEEEEVRNYWMILRRSGGAGN